MMKRLSHVAPYVLLMLVISAFFYKSILYGFIPAPTDALVGLYHPWRDLYATTNPRGVPFKNFLITDPIRQQIPWRKIAMDQWRGKETPSWNPYTFLGTPLVSNIQAAIYQPVNIFFTIFNFPTAWSLIIILQPLFGASFLYLYLRNLKVSSVSSSVGALVWALSGFSIAWLTWGTIGWVATFIPLVLYGIDKVRDSLLGKVVSFPSLIHGSILVMVASICMVVSGHAQIALYGLIVSCLYGAYRLSVVGKKREIFLFIFISFVVILVGSYVVWQPFVRFYLSTSRSNVMDVSAISGWLLPAQHLIQFVIPDFFGNPATLNYYGTWNYGELVGYVGVVPFIFALSALFMGGISVFWSVVCIISLLLMIDSPLTHFIYGLHIPIYGSLQPTRLMVLVDLALSILSAYGLEAFLHSSKKRVYVTYAIITGLFYACCVIVLYLSRVSIGAETLTHLAVTKRNLFMPLMVLSVFGILLPSRRLFKKRSNAVLLTGIIFLIFIDLFRFGWKFTPFTPSEYFFPQTKVISYLQSQPKPFRVMSMDDRIMPPNTAGYFGIETIEGYDPLYPRDYVSFLYGGQSNSNQSLQRIFTLHDLHNLVLPYLNVRYVLSLDDIQDPDFLKVFEEGETKVYKYLKGYDRVYLSTHEALVAKEGVINTKGVIQPILGPNEFVSITAYADNAITIKTSVERERAVVILNRYDTGWRAYLDGEQVPVFEANQIFQGVDVPKGDHTVKLLYKSL